MSAVMAPTVVILMPTVPIRRDPTIALATLGMMGMVITAQVKIYFMPRKPSLLIELVLNRYLPRIVYLRYPCLTLLKCRTRPCNLNAIFV